MNQPNYSHQLVSVLLDSRKVNINACDSDGRTPLHIACINGHRTSSLLLIENGCDIMIKDNSGMTAGTSRTQNLMTPCFHVADLHCIVQLTIADLVQRRGKLSST
jgi:ankyrin repeat protein